MRAWKVERAADQSEPTLDRNGKYDLAAPSKLARWTAKVSARAADHDDSAATMVNTALNRAHVYLRLVYMTCHIANRFLNNDE